MIVTKFSHINELHTTHFVGSIIPVWPFEVYDLFWILLSCLTFLHWLKWLICSHFFFLLQLQEKQRLIDFADALRSKLNYFDELENVRFDCWLDWIFSWFNFASLPFFWFNHLIVC